MPSTAQEAKECPYLTFNILAYRLSSPLTSQATHFGLKDDFFPTLTPPNSFIQNYNNYKHQANMDI